MQTCVTTRDQPSVTIPLARLKGSSSFVCSGEDDISDAVQKKLAQDPLKCSANARHTRHVESVHCVQEMANFGFSITKALVTEAES